MQNFAWILTIVALIGSVLNSQGNRSGFFFWLISNLGFCVINILIGQVAQAFLFLAYFFISINGVYKWKVKN